MLDEPHDEMIAFINMHRAQFGVEAICRTLRVTECGFITSRGYRAAKTRPPSDWAVEDELLVPQVQRIHAENYGVYGGGRRCTTRSCVPAGRSAATTSPG